MFRVSITIEQMDGYYEPDSQKRLPVSQHTLILDADQMADAWYGEMVSKMMSAAAEHDGK